MSRVVDKRIEFFRKFVREYLDSDRLVEIFTEFSEIQEIKNKNKFLNIRSLLSREIALAELTKIQFAEFAGRYPDYNRLVKIINLFLFEMPIMNSCLHRYKTTCYFVDY